MRHALIGLVLGLLAAGTARAQAPIGDFANGAMCAVSTGYDDNDTAIDVVSGCGTLFPAVPFYAVWWNNTDYPGGFNSTAIRDPNFEVVLVTNVSSDTLTVTRAQQGTTGTTKNTGGKTYWIVASATADTYDNINTALGATFLTTSTNSVLTNEAVLAGTTNQIVLTGSTLSTPQDIHTAATPTFGGWTATSDAQTSLIGNAYNATAGSGLLFRMRRGRGTASAIRRVQSADSLLLMDADGYYAADDSSSGTVARGTRIASSALENWTVTGRGAQMEFQTVGVGETALAVRGSVTATGLTVPANHFLSASNASYSSTPANWFRMSQSSTGVGTLQNAAAGKIVFDPTEGSNGQLQFHSSSEARRVMQLEQAIATGGTERTDTWFTLFGRSGVGAVSDYFSAQLNFGAIDAVSAATSYAMIGDGSWTNGGGFQTNTQFLIWDEVNDKNLLRHVQSEPKVLETGDTITNGGLTLQVNGRDLITGDADALVGGVNVIHTVTSADNTDTRSWYANKSHTTINTTGTNANKTFYGAYSDTTNTSVTGTTYVPERWNYGGSELLRLTSAGVLKLGGTASRGTTEGTAAYRCFNGTAPAGTLTNGADLYCSGGELLSMDAAGNVHSLTNPEESKTFSIENPGAAENFGGIRVNQAITIIKVVAVLQGSASPSVTWQVRHGTDRSAAGADVFTAGKTTTSVTTGSSETATFNDATVAADEFIWLATTAQSGTVTGIHVTVFYTVD